MMFISSSFALFFVFAIISNLICCGIFVDHQSRTLLLETADEERRPQHLLDHPHPQSACQQQSQFDDIGWEFAGPTTYVSQFDNDDRPKLSSAAAVQNVVQGMNNTWFIGSVNGGIWTTKTLNAAKAHWINVLDGQLVTCSSISALYANDNRIYAGCGGSTSSEQGYDWNVVNSGDWGGIMISYDNGNTWSMLKGFPSNYYITDIIEFDDSNTILVATQSHLFDRNDGGIWQSIDGGQSFTKILSVPTFTLTQLEGSTTILATHARSTNHSISIFDGKTFENLSMFLPWKDGAIPFYTCATQLKNKRIVVGGLTRLSGGLPNNTNSQIFISNKGDIKSSWKQLKQPTRMDEDSMPKDRMAVFADPSIDDLVYVAGNAGALAWRVNTTIDEWTKMWDEPDVIDGSIPHGDCRNYAWDYSTDRLILVSDGGIFAREHPRQAGGRWISLNGDYSALELLSAHYDPHDDRYVMGAQDNCAIITKPGATSSDLAYCFVEGDGTVTIVDTSIKPSRLFGTTQFLGVGTIYHDPSLQVKKEYQVEKDNDEDDDDDCGGLCFAQGDTFVEVPIDKYFSNPSSFPFFVHPYTLNKQKPTLLHFWVNGTDNTSGYYEFNIPFSVKDKDGIAPPKKILATPPAVMILDFISGGYTNGMDDPNLLIGISCTHLYLGRKNESDLVIASLPMKYAMPVTLKYDEGARILGPLTHARTVFMTISPSDSRIIAVTGWESIHDNLGDESIFLTTSWGLDGWQNITGNLRIASGVSGTVRPSGMKMVELDGTKLALLVGTSSGIMITFLIIDDMLNESKEQQWVRLGNCNEFPIVLTADVDHEPISDRLVAATFGRGIYVLKDARRQLISFYDSHFADNKTKIGAITSSSS